MAQIAWSAVSELTTSQSFVYKSATALTNGDYTYSIKVGTGRDNSIHFTGTIGDGGSVTVYGSNDYADFNDDPTTGGWVVLKDNQDNNITKTSLPGADIIVDNYAFIAVKVTAGDGTTAITPHLKLQSSL